jgi:hypothetical protein
MDDLALLDLVRPYLLRGENLGTQRAECPMPDDGRRAEELTATS